MGKHPNATSAAARPRLVILSRAWTSAGIVHRFSCRTIRPTPLLTEIRSLRIEPTLSFPSLQVFVIVILHCWTMSSPRGSKRSSRRPIRTGALPIPPPDGEGHVVEFSRLRLLQGVSEGGNGRNVERTASRLQRSNSRPDRRDRKICGVPPTESCSVLNSVDRGGHEGIRRSTMAGSGRGGQAASARTLFVKIGTASGIVGCADVPPVVPLPVLPAAESSERRRRNGRPSLVRGGSEGEDDANVESRTRATRRRHRSTIRPLL